MKPSPECFPCFLRQALLAARLATQNEVRQHAALLSTARLLPRLDWDRNPPFLATRLFRNVYRVLRCQDPYIGVKNEYNKKVKKLYPELHRIMEGSKDRFLTALKFALAGNIIDFGILEEFDLAQTLKTTLAVRLPPAKVALFRKNVSRARHLLYITDNAGEIGFDRFLITEMKRVNPSIRIVLGVKKHPIINDATPSDARYFGLHEIADLIDTGGNWVGTHPRFCGARFKKIFAEADMIVSKGQANWESLEELRDPRIAFLLKAKCPVVARSAGVNLNDVIIQ